MYIKLYLALNSNFQNLLFSLPIQLYLLSFSSLKTFWQQLVSNKLRRLLLLRSFDTCGTLWESKMWEGDSIKRCAARYTLSKCGSECLNLGSIVRMSYKELVVA